MMVGITQKKRKTGPAGEVTFDVGETASAAAVAVAQDKPSQSHAADQRRLPEVSSGTPGVAKQKAPLGFGSLSNFANLFHATTHQRAPVSFAAFHGAGNPFHGATQLRSPFCFGSFSSRANLFLAALQQTAPTGVSGVLGGGNHFCGATQLIPTVGFAGIRSGGNIFHASGMNSCGNHFHGSLSRQQPAPHQVGLAGSIGNLFTPQRIPVPFEGLNGVANLVHDNPLEHPPAGFTGIDGVGYVFHRITQQRIPVRITVDGGVAIRGNPPLQGSRHRRVTITMCDESEWDDGLTQLFRAIEVAPRNGHHMAESSKPAINENGYYRRESSNPAVNEIAYYGRESSNPTVNENVYHREELSNAAANRVPGRYFFLAERCLVCFKKFLPGDDIFLYMGEYAYCTPQCREMQMSYALRIEDFLKELHKQRQRRNRSTITDNSSASASDPPYAPQELRPPKAKSYEKSVLGWALHAATLKSFRI